MTQLHSVKEILGMIPEDGMDDAQRLSNMFYAQVAFNKLFRADYHTLEIPWRRYIARDAAKLLEGTWEWRSASSPVDIPRAIPPHDVFYLLDIFQATLSLWSEHYRDPEDDSYHTEEFVPWLAQDFDFSVHSNHLFTDLVDNIVVDALREGAINLEALGALMWPFRIDGFEDLYALFIAKMALDLHLMSSPQDNQSLDILYKTLYRIVTETTGALGIDEIQSKLKSEFSEVKIVTLS